MAMIVKPKIIYPDSDGQPMAENTVQFRWIMTLQGNLDALFRDRPDVFVAGDNLIYPVEGDPKIRIAPDVYVVFGRPKGDRGSYQVWLEEGIFPQVIFEVLSPGNYHSEMIRKFGFYDHHGAQEYYIYDPMIDRLDGWVRGEQGLEQVSIETTWTSPRLGVRFDLSGPEMKVFHPDGRPFLTFQELDKELKGARDRMEAAMYRAAAERQRAEAETQRAEAASRENARLLALLREKGIDPGT